jgi:ankyrin repeat protein
VTSNNSVIALLDARADYDAMNIFENTPVHNAAQYNKADCILTLLNAGANFNIKNRKGQKALDLANYENQQLILRWIKNNELQISFSKEPEGY